MDIQELLKNPPQFYTNSSGNFQEVKLSDDILYFLDEQVTENSKTLETGAGCSTILFAIKSSHHTCIVPKQQEVNRIKDYCHKHNISTEKIDFKVDGSQNVLPYLNTDDLDCILIDGSHAFPIPFIDWQYTHKNLKVGGKLIIDDTQIWTGEVLKKFLISEPEWKFQKESTPRTAIFTKVKQCTKDKWFGEQVYTVKNSRIPIWFAKIKTAIILFSTGDFPTLASKVIKLFRPSV
ncbi:MAG: class I SAM-dependent methyltransferase [Moorea sp. SIOASIH]|uniref:class I SAM-dependent methyltransferase n=1 Tax=Moorena sp. SIOASIH TaxID=2607817 RepID=UPI0013B91A5C|nr:class I SAM-dependent methyltransferase [Moorena sp. SIOASIH]NEO40505.1 class I SAM-dependent methyltransferase [Moorena sp. SIOASIH]